MNFFGQLLYTYRDTHRLTQEQCVSDMMHFSDTFSKLNTVTFSRWETGSTSPGTPKKQQVLKYLFSKGFFNDREVKAMLKERYTNFEAYLEKAFRKQYRSMIGNFPEQHQSERTLYHLNNYKYKQKHLEHIINIGASMTVEGYYTLSVEQLEAWCSYPSTFAIVSDYHGQHAGHYIILKIKNDVAEDIAFHRKSPLTLSKNDFCAVEEKGTCFVFTFYARSPKIAAWLIVEHYRYFVQNSEFIDNVMIYTTRDDTMLATKNYGIKIVQSGKDPEYGVNWVGMLSPLEDILFSSKVVGEIY